MKTQETTTAVAATKQSAKKPKASKAKVTKANKATKQAANAEARPGSKKEIVLKLLRRDQGATIADIAKATDWQNHSIRGFISGQVTKRMKLKVESTKSEAGERTYRIAT